MKFLIVEDDAVSRKVLLEYLSSLGQCDIAEDGQKALDIFKTALRSKSPYDLILMDIMMPIMDGQEALLKIRELEKQHDVEDSHRVKVIMTTALGNPKNVIQAFYKGGAMSYLVKPIERARLYEELRKIGFKV